MVNTFANGTGGMDFFNSVAAFSYSGANFLQWPHLCNDKHSKRLTSVTTALVPWGKELDQNDIMFRYFAIKVTLIKFQHVSVCKNMNSERC